MKETELNKIVDDFEQVRLAIIQKLGGTYRPLTQGSEIAGHIIAAKVRAGHYIPVRLENKNLNVMNFQDI